MTLLESFIALDTLNLLALLGVVFIGLPHGAMDGALAVHFGWMGRPTRAVAFLLAYVGLAGLVVLSWAIAPVLSFIVFLAISTFHFGRGDATSSVVGRGAVESIARGSVVIGGISQFHRTEANDIFLTIVGADTTGVWLFLDVLVVFGVACIVETLLFKQQHERTAFGLEIGALSLLFIAVPPLVGFAVYFCFVHSFRHFSSMRTVLQSTVSSLRITQTTVVFSLLTWAFGLVVLVQQSASIGVEPALLRVVFIGLAALTVPHMLLVDGFLGHTASRRF